MRPPRPVPGAGGATAFDDLAPGRYQVEVTLGDQLVTIPELRIGR